MPKRPEQQLHMAVASYLRVALRPPTIWTTIGHGGGGRVRGGILKAMGVQRGWPDILIIQPAREGHPSSVLGIELKAGKGMPSPEQRALAGAFMRAGCLYKICRSLDDVDHELYINSIPRHASLGSMRAEIAKEVGPAPLGDGSAGSGEGGVREIGFLRVVEQRPVRTSG